MCKDCYFSPNQMLSIQKKMQQVALYYWYNQMYDLLSNEFAEIVQNG